MSIVFEVDILEVESLVQHLVVFLQNTVARYAVLSDSQCM